MSRLPSKAAWGSDARMVTISRCWAVCFFRSPPSSHHPRCLPILTGHRLGLFSYLLLLLTGVLLFTVISTHKIVRLKVRRSLWARVKGLGSGISVNRKFLGFFVEFGGFFTFVFVCFLCITYFLL